MERLSPDPRTQDALPRTQDALDGLHDLLVRLRDALGQARAAGRQVQHHALFSNLYREFAALAGEVQQLRQTFGKPMREEDRMAHERPPGIAEVLPEDSAGLAAVLDALPVLDGAYDDALATLDANAAHRSLLERHRVLLSSLAMRLRAISELRRPQA